MSTVMDAMEALAACLCAQLQIDSPSDEVCFCGVLPGVAIPIDVGSCTTGACGMAYLRLNALYPSVSVGVADLQPANCAVGIGFDLEIGVFRCYPLEPNGSSPPDDVNLAVARLQVTDALSMRKALSCCDWLPDDGFVVGQYTPMGPAGGVIGGNMPISAWLP